MIVAPETISVTESVPTVCCDNDHCDREAVWFGDIHGCCSVLFCADCHDRWVKSKAAAIAWHTSRGRSITCGICFTHTVRSVGEWGNWNRID